jgi:P27 family predicted phage terminase small subunit
LSNNRLPPTDDAPKKPNAPPHLGKRGRAFWQTVVGAFHIEDDQQSLLVAACECLDVAARALRKIKREGMTFKDRFDQPRPNPAVDIHRKAVAEFRMARRELGLDVATAAEPRGNASPNFKD